MVLLAATVFYLVKLPSNLVVEVTDKPQLRATINQEVSIVFVGDIMLSRSVGKLMAEKNDYNWPFAKIGDYLKNFDLTFGNLETSVSSRGVKVGSIYSFRTDPRAVEGLKNAGFDVLSIANNHIWDYSREAFLDTIMHLRNAGIDPVGGGANSTEAHAGVVKEIKGTKIGFLAYTDLLPGSVASGPDKPGVSYLVLDQVIKNIKEIRTRSDVVVVSFHLGDEYQTTHNAKQEKIYKAAIDAGADLIIGHHPHVVQEVEQYQGGWIAYSLGNFVFDQNFSEATMSGLALEVKLKEGKVDSVNKIPISISREYQPSVKR